MHVDQYIDDATGDLLRRLLPSYVVQPHFTALPSGHRTVHLDLPLPTSAEYGFQLWVYPEKQISARLLGSNSRGYFWYMPFEEAAYGNSIEKVDLAFLRAVELLISHETRIIQTRGLLTSSFRCEYGSNVDWTHLSSHSALTLGFSRQIPHIAGRKRIYYSPRLIAE